MFGVSKSAADRILDHLAPLLPISPGRRPRKDTVYIVDGTLVPTRDRSVAASSKHYRYSTNLQVVIDANSRLAVAIGIPLPGSRNDCRAFTSSGDDRACRGAQPSPMAATRAPACSSSTASDAVRHASAHGRRQRTPAIAGPAPGSTTPCPG